uniref:DUF148 domain-containing protein n=1 Tax=Caenorhabditis tropicalis TaxID=1561998 RepID=A0A1I7UW20_9PELO
MVKLLILLFVSLSALAAPMTEQEALNELRNAGMSENGLNTLIKLDNEFKEQYPVVGVNKAASDKFIAEFSVKAQSVVNSLTPEDQTVYNNHVKKYSQE